MGKVEIGNFCGFMGIFDFFKGMLIDVDCSHLRFISILSKSFNLIGCQGDVKGKVSNICLKKVFLETIRRMKLKLVIHAYDITLYISYVYFYFQCPTTFVAMATKSFHRPIMGNVVIILCVQSHLGYFI